MDNVGKINTTDRNSLPEAERAIPNMVSSANGELEQVAAGIEQVAAQMAQGKTAEEILQEQSVGLQEQSAGATSGEVVRRSMERGNVAIGAVNMGGVANRGYLPRVNGEQFEFGEQGELNVNEELNGGRQAIFGGTSETVATLEVSEDKNILKNAQEFVGEETKLQVVERKAGDLEDLKNESGLGVGAEIVGWSQGQRGVVAEKKAAKLLGQRTFKPNELMRWYREQRDAMLLDFENPRRIGDRN